MMPTRAFPLLTFTAVVSNLGAQRATLQIGGAVSQPLALSEAEFASMRHQAISVETHDEKGVFGGVALIDLLIRAGVPSGADLEGKDLTKYVIVTGADGYRVTFALAELDGGLSDRVVLVADSKDGKPLPANATPYQVVVPGEKRSVRWVRQVIAIDVFDPDRR
ncbi:MAG TPA: molybdopterin-dependent oxidoreductase [Vicinamibacterales bacterium]|nr:molybdopterin-dependent oxidoreductase [Vicinamibacterales bacterium]